MGSLAQLAAEMGFRVTGCDKAVYPPMSTQLEDAGIELIDGFSPDQLALEPDLVVVGNVVSRGNPLMEAVLDRGIPYISGPQWLAEHVLHQRWVLAVSGTHGKTTTSTMLAWILESAGMKPGFLIGGIPGNFDRSARLGESDFFVIEADEYDTAFFDKRSKFVHYRPKTLVINNLEYDHADIFENLGAIQKQFHHLLRMVPAIGQVIYPSADSAISDTLALGCWSEQKGIAQRFSLTSQNADWQYTLEEEDGHVFSVYFQDTFVAKVDWGLTGRHNVLNALSAIAAAYHVGVLPEHAIEALSDFQGVKRRMEIIAQGTKAKIYDDFAHHPTAIKSTLEGLRAHVKHQKIIAVIEPRSNTMQQGVHRSSLLASAEDADAIFWKQAHASDWHLSDDVMRIDNSSVVCHSVQEIIDGVCKFVAMQKDQVHIVIMSNGGFDGIHQQMISAIEHLTGPVSS